MKTTLFSAVLALLFSYSVSSQIVGGQVNDFQDGTVQSWSEGGPTTNPPINIATGGPAGAGDRYLQNDSSGGGGGGSKMVMFNPNIDWGGNYTSAGIIAITCDVRVSTNTLNLRVAMEGSGGRISSANSVDVAPSSSWSSIVLPITVSDMALAGGTDIAATLANVTELRILSNTSPNWRGASIDARLEIDNITAVTTLSTDDFTSNSFKIYPNPAHSELRLELSSNRNNAEIEVFDILGKKVLAQSISNLNSTIDVSQLNGGAYILRATIEGQSQSQRFIKL
ncbi:T9SS type A sorting domain-containing protein [Hyunsoonleella rubra]|uniref:T9SS type A sorting domain-containing protein n=1 Tax=Hyunsoonleella rubra TaxID=1737062 RepID=A0ABW5TFM6_9FLAO